MASKTITVTDSAYEALKSMKLSKESFSDAILRIANRKPLSSFYGILSAESGKRLEEAVAQSRKTAGKLHQKRLKRIAGELKSKWHA